MISKFVRAWNWVDDEDKPLPPPSTPGIMNELNLGEIRYITKLFSFADSEKKG
jgi:hypothetical protein